MFFPAGNAARRLHTSQGAACFARISAPSATPACIAAATASSTIPEKHDQCAEHFDAFYRAITEKGLAKKGTLIGISRGGLYAYNWAAQNPDKVVCIYGDAPECDIKSWPGGKGAGKGSPADWQALIKDYGFTE